MAIPPAGRARRPSGRSSRVVVGPTVPRPRRTERCPSQRGPEPVRRRRRELTGIGDHLKTEGHLPGKSLRCRGSGRHARRSFGQRPSSWSAMAASRSWRAHAATAPQPRRCATEPVRRRSRRASGGGSPRPSARSCGAYAARTDPGRGAEILKKPLPSPPKRPTGSGRAVPVPGARADAPPRHTPLPPAERVRRAATALGGAEGTGPSPA